MKEISSVFELDQFIVKNISKNKKVMLYFGAKWCGPCKLLKQNLTDEEFMKSMKKLKVAYLDVDNVNIQNLVDKYNVQSLPTQIFIKLDDNKIIEVSKIEGYDVNRLKKEYNNY